MKKLKLHAFTLLFLLYAPVFLSGQTTPAPAMGSAKLTDTTSCGIISYNGQTYRTAIIGRQCWMKDNLNIGKWTDQSQIQKQTDNGVIEKYCYGDDFVNCDQWGGLYQWDEAMLYVQTSGTQGICPPGWHLPSCQDWKALIRYLGGDDFAGGKMKFTGSNGWQTPNVGATDASGFTALPGGYFDFMAQQWHDQNRDGYFWTSDALEKGTAAGVTLTYRTSRIDIYEEYTPSALSVRCVRDE